MLPTAAGGLGILDLERFGRALRLRWLWFSWTNPEKPWSTSELPVDNTDRALFAAATRVRVNNGKKGSLLAFKLAGWPRSDQPVPAAIQTQQKKEEGRV